MVSPHYFIVKPFDGKRYDNMRKYGDVDFIISASIEDHTVTQRLAIVENVPIGYDGPVEVGDFVIVHHNVFRIYYDQSGLERSSWNYYKNDIFAIDSNQLYLYKKKEGKWKAPSPYCFIEPIKKKESLLASSEVNEELWGRVAYYPNDSLEVGQLVSFLPDMEYEFTIDGKVLYRMKTDHVCLKA